MLSFQVFSEFVQTILMFFLHKNLQGVVDSRSHKDRPLLRVGGRKVNVITVCLDTVADVEYVERKGKSLRETVKDDKPSFK